MQEFALDKEGTLVYQANQSKPRIVVPTALVPQLISECHDHALAGHYHPQAVFEKLKPRYYWPSMGKDIKSFCDSCVKCHSHKQNHREKPAPLGTNPVPLGPWETLHTDILGPLPETPEGHRWILLVVCAFTKFVELIPLKDTTAETVAVALVETFHRYGMPSVIVSDNGVQFRAKLLAEINRLLDVKHVFISAYHAQANSNVERMCGVVKNMIAVSLNRTQREWSQFLGASQHAINAAYQTSNKWSPAFLMFGRHFRLPIEKVLSSELSPNSGELDDLVTILRERQADAIHEAIENQKTAREKQRRWYNRRAKEKGFEIGDLVYVYRPVVKPGNAKKLTAKWSPGYVVEGKLANGLTYVVRKPGSRKPAEKVHVNRLKPCPQSHVYRTARKTAHVMGTGRALHTAQTPQAMHRNRNQPETGDEDSDGDTSQWEGIPDLFSGRPRRPGALPANIPTDGESSGVTTVLEAAETEPHSGEETDAAAISAPRAETSSSSESDPVSAEDEPQPAARPRRPQRLRRPPIRYSP